VRADAKQNLGGPRITEPLIASPDEFPTLRTREDGFSGLIDLWAHGQRPSTPFLLQ
jgi:hypothetical protein